MANQPEIDQFDSGVYQIEQTDPVLAGLGGVSNKPLLNLANRTKYLYNRIAEILSVAKGYVVAGGTANAITATYTPAVTALTDGMTLRFRGAAANTGATTFKAGSAAASPVYGQDHAALTGGEIVLNGECEVQYNAALNGGNGAWVLVRNSGGLQRVTGLTGAPTAPTPAVGTNNTQIATMAAVQAQSGNLAGYQSNNLSFSISALNTGRVYYLYGSTTGQVATLPALASNISGTTYWFENAGTVPWTIAASASDSMTMLTASGASNVTSMVLAPGDCIAVVLGSTSWRTYGMTLANMLTSPALSGTPTAPTPAAADNTTKISTTAWVWTNIQALVASCISAVATAAGFTLVTGDIGYLKLPSWLGGVIVQWGWSANLASATTGVTFPLAFPSACWRVVSSGYLSSYGVQGYAVTNSKSVTGFGWGAFANNSGSAPVNSTLAGQVQNWWLAIGN